MQTGALFGSPPWARRASERKREKERYWVEWRICRMCWLKIKQVKWRAHGAKNSLEMEINEVTSCHRSKPSLVSDAANDFVVNPFLVCITSSANCKLCGIQVFHFIRLAFTAPSLRRIRPNFTKRKLWRIVSCACTHICVYVCAREYRRNT